MHIIVGLGNPGREYTRSRHNIGFRCIDAIGERYGIRLKERRRLAVIGHGWIEGEEVLLARPRTFVNRSGEAVRYLLSRFSTGPGSLVVIYDDMDLPPGRIRIRPKGSAGGHNGMKSIIETIGTQEFPRIRVGIGKPQEGDPVAFVLGCFTPQEEGLMREAVQRVTEAVACLLKEGLEAAMNRFNAP